MSTIIDDGSREMVACSRRSNVQTEAIKDRRSRFARLSELRSFEGVTSPASFERLTDFYFSHHISTQKSISSSRNSINIFQHGKRIHFFQNIIV